MDYLDAKIAIALAAKENGMTTKEFTREIELAINEAMSSDDPLAQELWSLVPRKGEKPTAVEFIAHMRSKVHNQ